MPSTWKLVLETPDGKEINCIKRIFVKNGISGTKMREDVTTRMHRGYEEFLYRFYVSSKIQSRTVNRLSEEFFHECRGLP